MPRRPSPALLLAVGLALAPAAGCRFAWLTGSNASIYFRTPDPPAAHPATVEVAGARIVATWIGHATVLLQLDDKFVLTDPVFTEYVGGVSHRLVAPGLGVDELPPLAAVLVSHRHLDHLSPDSLEAIGARAGAIVVPPGAGKDVPAGPRPVVELPRWASLERDGLRITAVPVDHNGGRILDRGSHPDAFTGFVVEYHGLAVYFAGDTAFAPDRFAATAARFPRLDLALLPIGPIEPRATTHANHMDPADALAAAAILGAGAMLPIHHDTFVHSYDAPGDCVAALRRALAAGSPYPADRVHLLGVGEQRVFADDGARAGIARAPPAVIAPPAAIGTP